MSGGPTRRTVIAGLAATGAAADWNAGESLPLWHSSPPGVPRVLPRPAVEQRSPDPAADRWITGIDRPALHVRRAARPDGSAVILIPGGGYGFLAWDNEGEEQARWLTARGTTCFILTYRLPGEGWADRALVPLQDAQRALRLVRARAAAFGIDPKRIAVLGFSAGGHLAGSIATRHAERVYAPLDAADRLSARPDLVGMIYPVVSLAEPFTHAGSRDNLLGPNSQESARRHASVDLRVDAETPPVFLAHASDDDLVPIANSLAMYGAMLTAKRQAELHAFDQGGHGFGARLAKATPASAWPELFAAYRTRVFGG